MGKKKSKNRIKREKRSKAGVNPPSFSWQDKEGFHFLTPGKRPSPEQVEEMTLQYQENIRKSPYWRKIVKLVGSEKAEELLKQCQVKID
jgi:hypothetical protein